MFYKTLTAVALAATTFTAVSTAAHADTYPSQPIKWIVPFPAGGSTDIFARVLSESVQQSLGQTLVVENRGGAGGSIGAGLAAKAAPDGYTITSATVSTHAINASLYPNLQYDPVADFEPVILLGYVPNVLIVGEDSPYKSVADLIAAGKTSQLTFASSGNGTSQHLTTEVLKTTVDADFVHVPYRGSPQALQDLMGGRVDFMFDQTFGMIQSGKVRPLAVSADKRSPILPDVPTLDEAGVKGFNVLSWHAIYAPAGTPKPVVDQLNDAFAKALTDPAVVERLGAQGLQVVGGTPAQLATLTETEIKRWAQVVESSGAKMD